jgi:hypothetical protein
MSTENVTVRTWRNSSTDTTLNTEGKYQQKQQSAPYATKRISTSYYHQLEA